MIRIVYVPLTLQAHFAPSQTYHLRNLILVRLILGKRVSRNFRICSSVIYPLYLLDWLKISTAGLSYLYTVYCIKMNVPPIFLYLFQCIPLFIPKHFFRSLEHSSIHQTEVSQGLTGSSRTDQLSAESDTDLELGCCISQRGFLEAHHCHCLVHGSPQTHPDV